MTIETTAIYLLSRLSCQNVHDWEQTQEHSVVGKKCSRVVKNIVFRGNKGVAENIQLSLKVVINQEIKSHLMLL